MTFEPSVQTHRPGETGKAGSYNVEAKDIIVQDTRRLGVHVCRWTRNVPVDMDAVRPGHLHLAARLALERVALEAAWSERHERHGVWRKQWVLM